MSLLESHLPAGGKPLDLEVSRLRKTYETEPVVIDGIVSESPQSAMPSRVFGGGYRIHMFSFAAWKIDAETVRTDELLLSRAIPNSDSFKYRLDDYSYQRIRVLLSGDQTRAVVLEGMYTQTCPEDLSSIASSLSNPFTAHHKRFGTLVLNRGLHFFSGTTKWNGSDIDISIPAKGEQFDPELIKRAEMIFALEDKVGHRVSRFLVESVVSEHENDELIADELGSRLDLQGIHLSETGSAEFWFDDGDLWGGHSLVVRLTPDDQLSFSVEG